MANVSAFRAWRYDAAKTGGLERVITQPYDKITPEMLRRYQSLSPYNLAHVIKTADYAAAAARLQEWKYQGVLVQDPAPALYPYFQEYTVPGTGERLVRKALIGALKLEEYRNGVVFRHELTLAGPKQDRLDLMRATRAHCELIFLLHEDPGGKIAALLDQAAEGAPAGRIRDDFGDTHSVWVQARRDAVEAFQQAFAPLRLLIADGHHRYETALAFEREQPAAQRILVALVSMEAAGLTILPTHRALSRVAGFDPAVLLDRAQRFFEVRRVSVEEGRAALKKNTLGALLGGGGGFHLFRLRPDADLAAALPDLAPAQRTLDVVLLHRLILGECLGISEEATRQEKNIEYLREFEKGVAAVNGGVQACFFLHPVAVGEVRDIAYAGGVMPQKSTDFYPKALSGFTFQFVDAP